MTTGNKTRAFMIALAGLALTTPAKADTLNNLYLSGAIGVTSTSDADFEDSGTTGDFEFDNAPNIAIAVGNQFTNHIRGEIELSYCKGDIDTLNVDGSGSFDTDGDLTTTALLANGYYDFDIEGAAIKPYLSAGIGLARHSGELNAGGVSIDENDTVFAYQLGAGASYAVAANTSLFGGYRYLGSSDPEFDTLEAEYDAHEFRAGLRYGF